MVIKKVKQKVAAALTAALVLQGIPLSVQAVVQDAKTAVQNETLKYAGEMGQTTATGVNVTYHTQEEIREYVKSSGAKITDAVTFRENPVTEAPYALGRLSDETLGSAIRMLNQIRYIAGIPYDVDLDEDYINKTQAASLVNYVNDKMSHYPDKPEGMSDEMYELAREGAKSSNIAWGSGTSWNLNEFIVESWMEDGDSSNIERVGHRRWLLNPSMKKTGFGLVKGKNGTHCAVYAFDRSRQAENYGVMWPAQNMPTEYFGKEFPWSVSMGTELDESAVHVTLTRNSDGRVWNFSQASADGVFYVNNTSRGQTGCIIFRPDGVDYNAGDSFNVKITGLNREDVSYNVNFFELEEKAVDSVSVTPETASVTAGKTRQFNKEVTVRNGAAKTVTWTVSGNRAAGTKITQTGRLTVAENEEAATLTVRATSTVDATKYGEATVTVLPKQEVPKPAVDSVSVTPETASVTAGKTRQFNKEVTVRNGAAKTVTWTVSGNRAAGTKITQTGWLTVAENEEAATLTVRATSTVDATKYGEATVTVLPKQEVPKPAVDSVSVTPETASVTAGTTQQFREDVTVQNGAAKTVTWSVRGNSAAGTEINSAGLLTVAKDEKPTTLIVRATSTADTTKYGEAVVTVLANPSGNTDTSMPQKPVTGTLPEKGKTYTIGTLKYKVTKSAAKNGTVTVVAPTKKTGKTVSIPNTVKIKDHTFKVTAIGNKAFKNNKNLKQVVIGTNVTSIGTSAFEGDAKLATVKINTTRLKTVKEKALKGIAKKAEIKVPKGKTKAYKKLLKKGGLPAKAKIS